MRYYDIKLTSAATEQPLTRSDGAPYRWTSHPNGIYQPPDPGALNIVVDLFTVALAPRGDPVNVTNYVRIDGIPLTDIGQANNLQGAYITVYGGMGKGLPLANPAQAGLLVEGWAYSPFGNWINTEMSLDLRIAAGNSPLAPPRNIVISWKAGTPLAQAVQQTLTTAFPGYAIDVQISPNLVLAHDEHGFYASVGTFAAFVKRASYDILASLYGPVTAGTYSGVDIVVLPGKRIRVNDGTSQAGPKQIEFTDLIGQPVWSGVAQNIGPGAPAVQCTCVMRADIQVGDFVKLPPSLVTVTPTALNAYSQLRQGSIFQATWRVISVRHVGNFRQAAGTAWVTILDMLAVSPQPGGSNP